MKIVHYYIQLIYLILILLNIKNFSVKDNCELKNIFKGIKKECKIIINDNKLNNLYLIFNKN